MKQKLNLFIVLVITLLITGVTQAQVAGEIFTKEKANKLFGKVNESVTLPLEKVNSFIKKADDFIMFKIVDNSLIVLDSQRNTIFNEDNIPFTDKDVFYAYNTFVFEELINSYNNERSNSEKKVIFEKREKVFSVTAGKKTMEKGVACPPICPTNYSTPKISCIYQWSFGFYLSINNMGVNIFYIS